MIVEELQHVPPGKRTGPIIVCEYSQVPWRHNMFGVKWRAIESAVGVPAGVQNRDRRAGGITEAADVGVPLDSIRRHASHSKISTTARYSRGHVGSKNEVARQRVAGRGTNRNGGNERQ